MAEISRLWETATGTGDSDTGGIEDDDWFQIFRSFFTRTSNLGGVAPDFQNELAVTGTSSPVSVNTGAALVYGIPYFNSASVTVAIATPASSTRVDRIVLRASYAAQTVRITRIAGTEGAGTPAMTQSAGTTWDIPLANVSITTGGVITVTDAREWLLGIGDSTVDSTKLADDAVTFAKMQNIATDSLIGRDTASSGDPENITLNATLSMTGSGALQRAALTGDVTATAGSNATTIANDAVTFAKMQNVATDSLVGRDTAGSGDPENILLNATLSMDGSGNLQRAALTGDVTASAGSNATTIANDAVTNAKLNNMAANTIKGRVTASTGDPEDLTATQARTIINVEDGADVTDAGNVGTAIHGATAKTTPVSADEFALIDSAASNVLKRITYANLVTALGAATFSTFTPTYLVAGSGAGVTFSSRSGYYADMGGFVFIVIEIVLSNKGAGTGTVSIGALPVTVGSTESPMLVMWNGTTTSYIQMQAVAGAGGTTLDLIGLTAATANARTQNVANTGMANTSSLNIMGFYKK